MTVGERIKYYREIRGLSQRQLSSLSGVPIGTLKAYETGSRNPKEEPLQRIAAELNVYPSAFRDLHTENEMDLIPYIIKMLKVVPTEIHGKKGADGKYDADSITISFRSEAITAILKKIADTEAVLEDLQNQAKETKDEKTRAFLLERTAEIEKELEWSLVQKPDDK